MIKCLIIGASIAAGSLVGEAALEILFSQEPNYVESLAWFIPGAIGAWFGSDKNNG